MRRYEDTHGWGAKFCLWGRESSLQKFADLVRMCVPWCIPERQGTWRTGEEVWCNVNVCFPPSELCVAAVQKRDHRLLLSFRHPPLFLLPFWPIFPLQRSKALISHLLQQSVSTVLRANSLQYADAVLTLSLSFVKLDGSCAHAMVQYQTAVVKITCLPVTLSERNTWMRFARKSLK